MRRMLPLLFVLPACFLFEPTETGSTAFVGRLLGPRGTPVKGVEVRTLEARTETDAAGEFAVAWKSPNLHVDFAFEGARYHRRSLEEDAGKRVDIRLPELRNSAVQCELSAPCDLALTWDLDKGLEARADTRCGDPSAPVLGVPQDTPRARCKASADGPERPVVVEDRGELWVVREPPVTVEVRVDGEDCTVAIRGVEHTGSVARADVSGTATASATCGGTPAVPALVGGERTEVTLTHLPGWASLALPTVNGGRTVRLAAEEGELAGAVLALEPTDGRLLLPVGLPPGTYRLLVGAAGLLQPPPEASPGTAHILETRDGWVGRLVLEAPLAPGNVPTR